MSGMRLEHVRLREPIMLEGVGWRSEIDATRDGVTLSLNTGAVFVFKEGRTLTILGPGLVLQCKPWSRPDES